MPAHQRFLRLSWGIALVLAGATLVSCPGPIPASLANQINDTTGPVITIAAPADRSEYSTVVQVTGRVTDSPDAESDVSLETLPCSYAVLGTTVSGEFSLAADGEFEFHFATRDANGAPLVEGLATLEVQSRDLSGNLSVVQLQLVPSATGDIGGFSVEPGNRGVVIAWEEVPLAQRYDLVEYNFGISQPDVTSPVELTGLKNGRTYAFQLTAVLEEEVGPSALSSVVSAMPVSPRTFTPWIRETGYKSISLEWHPSPDVSRFTIERSPSESGPWAILQSQEGTVYTDTNVDHDTRYYYRVTAYEQLSITSETISAVPGRFGYGVLTSTDLPGTPLGIAIEGSMAYVAMGNDGLVVIDVSEPAHPGTPIQVETPAGYARDVIVEDQIAYVNQYGDGIAILDVSNPDLPVVLSEISLAESAWSPIRLSWPRLLVEQDSGVAIVDVTDPENPTAPAYASIPESGYLYGVDIHGTYAYLATDTDLAVYGVSDPASPTGPFLAGIGSEMSEVAVRWPYAYALEMANQQLIVVDITNPEAPVIAGQTDAGISRARAIDLDGSYALLGDQLRGMSIVDVSDPTDPTLVATIDNQGDAESLVISGSYGFVASGRATGTGRLDVVELSDPRIDPSPTLVATDSVGSIATNGDFVFATVGWPSMIATVGLSGPADPGPPIYTMDPMTPTVVTCTDTRLYCSFQGGGVAIYDVPPSGIIDRIADVPSVNSYGGRFGIAGDYVYKGAFVAGLAVIESSDPALASLVGLEPTAGPAYTVMVRDSHLIGAAGTAGLVVVDISNPEEPGVPVYAGTTGQAVDVALAGNYALVADEGLSIIDISDLGAPEYKLTIPLAESPSSVSVSGAYAYVPQRSDGLAVIRIQDPENPGDPIYLDTGYTSDIQVAGSFAYLATPTGIVIHQLEPGAE